MAEFGLADEDIDDLLEFVDKSADIVPPSFAPSKPMPYVEQPLQSVSAPLFHAVVPQWWTFFHARDPSIAGLRRARDPANAKTCAAKFVQASVDLLQFLGVTRTPETKDFIVRVMDGSVTFQDILTAVRAIDSFVSTSLQRVVMSWESFILVGNLLVAVGNGPRVIDVVQYMFERRHEPRLWDSFALLLQAVGDGRINSYYKSNQYTFIQCATILGRRVSLEAVALAIRQVVGYKKLPNPFVDGAYSSNLICAIGLHTHANVDKKTEFYVEWDEICLLHVSPLIGGVPPYLSGKCTDLDIVSESYARVIVRRIERNLLPEQWNSIQTDMEMLPRRPWRLVRYVLSAFSSPCILIRQALLERARLASETGVLYAAYLRMVTECHIVRLWAARYKVAPNIVRNVLLPMVKGVHFSFEDIIFMDARIGEIERHPLTIGVPSILYPSQYRELSVDTGNLSTKITALDSATAHIFMFWPFSGRIGFKQNAFHMLSGSPNICYPR